MNVYDVSSVISQIDCNEWVKLQDAKSIFAALRLEYVNTECVWGEGECVLGCPSCIRMNEMLAERTAGDREGQRDMLVRCIKAIESIEDDLNSSAEWDRDYDVDPSGRTRNARIWIREAVSALRSLEVET